MTQNLLAQHFQKVAEEKPSYGFKGMGPIREDRKDVPLRLTDGRKTQGTSGSGGPQDQSDESPYSITGLFKGMRNPFTKKYRAEVGGALDGLIEQQRYNEMELPGQIGEQTANLIARDQTNKLIERSPKIVEQVIDKTTPVFKKKIQEGFMNSDIANTIRKYKKILGPAAGGILITMLMRMLGSRGGLAAAGGVATAAGIAGVQNKDVRNKFKEWFPGLAEHYRGMRDRITA